MFDLSFENDPQFRKLSYEEQQQVRLNVLPDLLVRDPEFNSLPEDAQSLTFTGLVAAPPALEHPESPMAQRGLQLLEGVKAGQDPQYYNKSLWAIFSHEATSKSLLGMALTGALGAIEDFIDPKAEQRAFVSFYGRDGLKIKQQLRQALQTSPYANREQLANFDAFGTELGMAGSIAELIVGQVGLVGTSLAKGGLLTSKLYSRISSGIDLVKGPIAREALTFGAEEGIGLGAQTAMTTVQGWAAALAQNPSYELSFKDVAEQFGPEAMVVYAGATAGGLALRTSKLLFRSMFKGFSETSENIAERISATSAQDLPQVLNDLFRTGRVDEGMLNSLEPQIKKQVVEALHDMSAFNPNDTVSRANVALAYAGFRASGNPGNYRFVDLADETREFTSKSLPEGITHAFMLADGVNGPGVSRVADTVLKRQMEGTLRASTPLGLAKAMNLGIGDFNAESAKLVISDLLPESRLKVRQIDGYFDPSQISYQQKLNLARQGIINVPKNFSSIDDVQKFAEEFTSLLKDRGLGAKQATELFQNMLSDVRYTPDNISGLEYAAKRHLDADVTQLGNGAFKLTRSGSILGTFANAREAMSYIVGQAVESGQYSLKEFSNMVRANTGFSIKVSNSRIPGKPPLYTLYDAAGNARNASTSLAALIESDIHLKNNLSFVTGPEMYVVDGASRRIRFASNIAMGDMTSLSSFAKDFESRDLEAFRHFTGPDGSDIMELATSSGETSYRLFNRRLGLDETFPNRETLQRYIRKNLKDFDGLKAELNSRGFSVNSMQNGTVHIIDDSSGEVVGRASNAGELETFLGAHPIPSVGIDHVLGLTDDQIREAQGFVASSFNREEASKLSRGYGWFGDHVIRNRVLSEFTTNTEMHLSELGRRINTDIPVKAWRNLQTTRRIAELETRKYRSVIQGIYDRTTWKAQTLDQQLLEIPEKEWEIVAKRIAPNYKFSAQDAERIRKLQIFYQDLADRYGIRADIFWTNYAPHLRDAFARHAGDIVDVQTLFEKAFGNNMPKDIEFFAESMRLDSVISLINERSAPQAAMAYASAMVRKQIMGSAQEHLDTVAKLLKGTSVKGPEAEQLFNYYVDSVKQVFGSFTPSERVLMNFSYSVTRAIQDGFNNVARKVSKTYRNTPEFMHREPLISHDLLSSLNKLFTLSLLGGRPWAVVRNFLDLNAVGAVFGNKNMLRTLQEVCDNPKIIENYIDRGYLTETLYSASGDRVEVFRNLTHKLMMGLENTDVLDRTVVHRLVEKNIDSAITRINAGKSNWNSFINDAQLDLLDSALQKQVLESAMRKDVNTAKYLAGIQMANALFGEFGRGVQGRVTRGLVGRAFGKLGTFSFQRLDLYRKLLTQGNAASRLLRASRFAVNGLVLTYALQQLGVNYHGFMWDDPVAFSGGPVFSMGIQAFQMIGTSPQAVVARDSFIRNILAGIPGSMQAKQVTKIQEYLEEGDLTKAALALSTAPTSEIREQQKVLSFLDDTSLGDF